MSLRRAHPIRWAQICRQQQRCYSAPPDNTIPSSKQKYVPTSGSYPKGFVAGTAHAQVKASNTKFDDLTLIASTVPCTATAVFTKNTFQAAPVQYSKQVLKRSVGADVRGVIINSGCANAVTGAGGLEDAAAMATKAQECLKSDDSARATLNTLVMSTGVIGQRLPIDRIIAKIPDAHAACGDTHDHWLRAARAICTTDTFPKLMSRTFTLPSHPETTYSIAGMTKGAGMIHPNMATLLSVICTDAMLESGDLKHALQAATKVSFNCISIDGDTSTNDTVALFANGHAAPKGDKGNPKPLANEDLDAFAMELKTFMVDLAKLVVRDGEGATKFVTVRVTGGAQVGQLKLIANSIVRSPLVKTALYGKDANWGRILCAVGYAPFPVDPKLASVSFIPADGSEELKLLVKGEPETVDEERAKQVLEMEDLEILVRLDDGADLAQVNEAVMWTCDFSHEYVTINGDYRT